MKKSFLSTLTLRTPLSKILYNRGKIALLSDVPVDLWSGSFSCGAHFLNGYFPLERHNYLNFEELLSILKNSTESSPYVVSKIHSFEWIRDLKTIQTYEARKLVRHFVALWMAHHPLSLFSLKSFLNPSCQYSTMGYRLANWISTFDFYGTSADDIFVQQLMIHMRVQFRILAQNYTHLQDPVAITRALRGVFWYAAYTGVKKSAFYPWIRDYQRALVAQTIPDMGHISSSPFQLFITLRDLLEVRFLLKRVDLWDLTLFEIKALCDSIYHLVRFIRFLRHNDGTLCGFKGLASQNEQGMEPLCISSSLIDSLLSHADVNTRVVPPSTQRDIVSIPSKTSSFFIQTIPILEKTELGVFYSLFSFEWNSKRDRIINGVHFVLLDEKSQLLPLNVSPLKSDLEQGDLLEEGGKIFVCRSKGGEVRLERGFSFSEEKIQVEESFFIDSFKGSFHMVIHLGDDFSCESLSATSISCYSFVTKKRWIFCVKDAICSIQLLNKIFVIKEIVDCGFSLGWYLERE